MAKIIMEVDTHDSDSIGHALSVVRALFMQAHPGYYVTLESEKDIKKSKRRNTKASRRTELLIIAILVLAYVGVNIYGSYKSDIIHKQDIKQQQQITKALSTLKCEKAR